MRSFPICALVAIILVLAACADQTGNPSAIQFPTPTAEPTPAPTSPPHSTPEPTPEPAPSPTSDPEPKPTPKPESNPSPTPASSTQEPTASPTPEPTSTAVPAVTLLISIAQIPPGVPEYERSQWKHWIDEDGDCQDARQEVLISESLVEGSFESERKCRVASGRWYGAFTGSYVEVPGDLDIDHLVPLKSAHNSGA